MTEFFCNKIRTPLGQYALMPSHQSDLEQVKKLPAGQPVKVTVTRIRNPDFHRKYFALLNMAFDYWELPEGWIGEKNFDRFRKDVIILAGFYEQFVRLNGDIRTEARSIAWGAMDQDEFEQLYAKTIEVIFKYVLKNYTGEDQRRMIRELEDFE